VDTGGNPALSCTIVPVPPSEDLGAQFLVRFNVNGTPVVTVRQKDVEKVVCTSPKEGYAQVASLTGSKPAFREVPVSYFNGALGVITAGS
jgi:hypothetical protein